MDEERVEKEAAASEKEDRTRRRTRRRTLIKGEENEEMANVEKADAKDAPGAGLESPMQLRRGRSGGAQLKTQNHF
jgi:hypothetical protein